MGSQTNRRRFLRQTALAGIACVGSATVGRTSPGDALPGAEPSKSGRLFRAGAAQVDISPETLPAVCSGGFLERKGDTVRDPLYVRALVLDDGATRLAMVVVDTLMMPRRMLDEVKRQAAAATGLDADRMLISATHTHSAPSVMGALGTGVDAPYAALLPGRIVKAIVDAAANLVPARIGWAAVEDPQDTNCRVWFRRPDRIGEDPFGERTIRAMMHPGYQNPDYIAPCGPEDPELSLLAVQRLDGKPMAVLANYSMHYFGAAPFSADYFGRFARQMAERLYPDVAHPPVVAMMSQGTSGDQHWMDYSRPRVAIDIDTYAGRVAGRAMEAYARIDFRPWVPLAMAERTLRLGRRLPGEARMKWARQVIAAMGDRAKPNSRPEVYALEQVDLSENPRRELKLQAVRIGGLGITAIPCEVYAITGLKLKEQSPLEQTINIELANGAEGYIPPPELFVFGGYNTWPARTAGLETTAEPKIVEAVLGLLEEIADSGRRPIRPASGSHARAVLAAKPIAYWPMDEIRGPLAADLSGHNLRGRYQPGVAFYLPGPAREGFCGPGQTSRAVHFAGGRLAAELPELGETYSVEGWFWNGLPSDARAVTGYMFSRGVDGVQGAPGEHLGIGGTFNDGQLQGKLFVYNGDQREDTACGTTEIPLKQWMHVVWVRDGRRVVIYLNGRTTPEVDAQLPPGCGPEVKQIWVGGRSDGRFGWEGKICQVAFHDRALTAGEAAQHFQAGGP